jgi:hypothetical protein
LVPAPGVGGVAGLIAPFGIVPLTPSLPVALPVNAPLPFPVVGVPASSDCGTVGPDEPVPWLGLTGAAELLVAPDPDVVAPCQAKACVAVVTMAATVTIVASLRIETSLPFGHHFMVDVW